MKPTMIKVALISLATASAGLAMAKSGEVTTIACLGGEAQTVSTSPQHSFGTLKLYGTIRTNPPGGLFDMMSSQTLGAWSSVEGKPSVWGHGEWVDKDGDKVLFRFSRLESLAGKAKIIHGTGKFSGLRGSAECQTTPFPSIPGVRTSCSEGKWRYTQPD
jgi:hypothetical protein